MVGRAAHLLRSPTDANDAFNEAERAPEGRRRHAALASGAVSQHDPGHAEEVTKEVLWRQNHPDALV
jgi:hypothetical protein